MNVTGALRAYLLDNTEITALVGTRVYGPAGELAERSATYGNGKLGHHPSKDGSCSWHPAAREADAALARECDGSRIVSTCAAMASLPIKRTCFMERSTPR